MRTLAASLISMFAGFCIKIVLIGACISYGIIRTSGGSGSFLPRSELERFLIPVIAGVLGAIFALFCSFVVYTLVPRAPFPGLRSILSIVVLGFSNAALFTYLEYANAVYGKEQSILDDFHRRIIMTTAVVEFAAGILIALVSVLIVRYFIASRTS